MGGAWPPLWACVYCDWVHCLNIKRHYCVHLKRVVPLQEMDTSKITATRGESVKKFDSIIAYF